MKTFSRWVLSFLFLGHLIDGVNREVVGTLLNNYLSVRDRIDEDSVHLHYRISGDSQAANKHAKSYVSRSHFMRRARSIPKSLMTACFPYDSCVSRCGMKPASLPYTCNCDSLCTLFSDCCIDYVEYCGGKNSTEVTELTTVDIPRPGCEILFKRQNLLTINKCPEHYTNAFHRKLCNTEISKSCAFSESSNVTNIKKVVENCKESVFKDCNNRLIYKCNNAIEPNCASFITKQCSSLASAMCHTCREKFWPVYDENGIIYRNSYCANCNSQKIYSRLNPYELNEYLTSGPDFAMIKKHTKLYARRCIPFVVDDCAKGQSHALQELCYNHSGAVSPIQNEKLVYKNMYCALCNNESIENLTCPTEASLSRGIRPLLKTLITGDVQGIKFDDIPAAFSILLNFGLDGRERMYFSSEGEEEMKRQQARCGKGKIWDPFSEVCRKLYCSTEFVLVDYRCVRKEIVEEENIPDNATTLIPDARSDFVHLSLSAEMELFDFLQFVGQDIGTISYTIRESLANSFNINIERIREVYFNISIGDFDGLDETLRFIEQMEDHHPIIFTIDFDLHEENTTDIAMSEPSVDNIVSMLAASLSMNGFEFDIKNVTSRIFEIHQTVLPLTSWCNSENGDEQKEYWNSEFSLIMEEQNSSLSKSQIKGIYINKTGKFYPTGKFVADILFQGYQFSGSLINVSGVAVVCDTKPKLNESCIRFLLAKHEYSLLENGSLFIHNESLRNFVDNSVYEIAENDSILVCIQSLQTNVNRKRFNINMDYTQAMVSYVLCLISVVALTVVLITYTAFESLRNLPGCNTMNLTLSLLCMQLTFIFGQRGTVKGTACKVVAHLVHYEILCCFMWMNVMAYDLYRTFGNKNILSNIRSKGKYLPRYMIYAYLSPLSVITIASVLDYYALHSGFAPEYGKNNMCWITNQFAAIVFFAAPLATIMCVNFIFFVLTILAMRSVKHVLDLQNQKTSKRGRNDLLLYARMALVIGLTWSLSFAAALVKKDKLAGQILTYLYIIFNTLQGVFILWVFVCNKRVYELYKGVVLKLLNKLSKRAKHEGSSASISRLANIMTRSVSTNTVVSTVSNASTSSGKSELSYIKE